MKKVPWILVTDDSPTVVKMIRAITRTMGYEVRELNNFLELPKLLRDEPPTVVVLDIERPGCLSGDVIGAYIRRFEKNHTPIIIYSSLYFSKLEEIKYKIDADAIAVKSNNIDELFDVMVDYLPDTCCCQKKFMLKG